MVFSKILVPLDGSKLGEAALPYIENLAIMAHSEVILFQAVPPLDEIVLVSEPIHGTEMDSYPSRARRAAERYLERLRERLAEKRIAGRIEIREGHAAESIVDFAKAEGVDLIAMSTHGSSGIRRWVFGSVADKVLHAAEAPVLLIRAARGENE